MEEIKNEFGHTLGIIRNAYNVSQSIMAASIPVPTETYIQWENGRRTPPDYVQTMVLQAITRRFHYEPLPTEDADENAAKVRTAAMNIMVSCEADSAVNEYRDAVNLNVEYGRYITCVKNVPPELLQGSGMASVEAGNHFYMAPYSKSYEQKTALCSYEINPLCSYTSNCWSEPAVYVLKKVREHLNLMTVDGFREQNESEEILKFNTLDSEIYKYLEFGYLDKKNFKRKDQCATIHVMRRWGERIYYTRVGNEMIESAGIYDMIEKLRNKKVNKILLYERLNRELFRWIDLETLECQDC